MNSYVLFGIVALYLAILFFAAFWGENKAPRKWVSNPYIYSLSIAVYCSAWTYYGSIGNAATSGISFLPIYLGPMIVAPLWIIILRKIIRISKQHKISSIADFISLRYGNNRFLGALVTVICVIGTVPYISLQLKAVSETYAIFANDKVHASTGILNDTTFYIAVFLALFATFYGTQKTDASEKHRGIITSVALESILKLVFFLIAGIYITFFLFDGTEDIYQKISSYPNFSELIKFDSIEMGINWYLTLLLSMFAIFLLPRQFQVMVVENSNEKHLAKAIWLFPLYLLLINLFVIFIAWGGIISFGSSEQAEYFTLLLPLENQHQILALIVFLGGFSAVISMVVVSTLALSTMVSNNLIIPYGFLDKFARRHSAKNTSSIKNIRRISIFLIIIAAYFFYLIYSIQLSLYSIGLISFIVIAQLAPSFFIGLFWNRGSSKAAITGIILGFLITLYCLILPFTIEALTGNSSFTDYGPWGIEFLKPYQLFGLKLFNSTSNAFFWSLTVNTFCYLIFSLTSKGNYRERNYAEMFVNNENYAKLQDNVLVWRGEAYVSNIKNVLIKFLGVTATEKALRNFFKQYEISPETEIADARLINYSEKLLTGSIGSASAKILIDNVVKEEKISLIEVLQILEESRDAFAHNKMLQLKSTELLDLTQQLKDANHELILKDKQKDEFLDTVAHELKTPITGIRAASEILKDDINEMPNELKEQFLSNIIKDSDRLSRLINNILDFEKLSTGRLKLSLHRKNFSETINFAMQSLSHIIAKKQINIQYSSSEEIKLFYDEDRILQVLTNLISNAIKFSPEENGVIKIKYSRESPFLKVVVQDNGKGIPEEDIDFIFDKFYQSKNQNTIKPEGSGLGLAISKQIIEKHNGKIWADKTFKSGAKIVFLLPIY